MVAARGGKVQYAGYHGAAGNYLVIDGAGTGVDYAYMHLAEPSAFRAGDRVYTGQRIGSVGETGNAQRLPPPLRALGRPGLVRRRPPLRPGGLPPGVGQLVLELPSARRAHSHSIVPGGFDVMSSVTRFTCGISLIIRDATLSSRSYGRRAQSAVIASSLVTARITTT